jgi:SAM-dependent methyltransferase
MRKSIVERMSEARVLRKCVGRPFLVANEWLWSRIPTSIKATRPISRYGAFLHSLVQLRSARRQFHGTFFFRNRPEQQLIRALSNQRTKGSSLRLSVLACSNGAEVYSILWTIRSARPDLKVITQAVDISSEVLEIGKNGMYSPKPNDLVGSPIFDRMTEKETQEMFDKVNDELGIKPWIKEGINWRVGDAGDPELAEVLGSQDIVVANRFLCHMAPMDAERCLRNLATLLKPGGYLFVSGVDLDIRTKVALDLGWTPVRDLIEEMHNGDPSVRRDWPWKYWGLEPFNRKRNDWSVRYASVFRLGLNDPGFEASLRGRSDGHLDSSAHQELVPIPGLRPEA